MHSFTPQTDEYERAVQPQRVGEDIWHHIARHGWFKCHFKPYCENNPLHPWTCCKRVAKFCLTICETTEAGAEGEGWGLSVLRKCAVSERFGLFHPRKWNFETFFLLLMKVEKLSISIIFYMQSSLLQKLLKWPDRPLTYCKLQTTICEWLEG